MALESRQGGAAVTQKVVSRPIGGGNGHRSGRLLGEGLGSPTITLGVYGHLFTNTDDRAAQVIETALSKTLMD